MALGFVFPVGAMQHDTKWDFKGMAVGRKHVSLHLSVLPGQLHVAFGDSIILASKRAALNLEGLCSPKGQLP